MPSIEEYLEHADGLAQEVVNAWRMNMRAGNAALLTDDFKTVLDKACRYRDARKVADNHRQFKILSESVAAEEEATRRAFAEAYKAFRENHQAPP